MARYDWESYRETVYQLYIGENWTLQRLRNHLNQTDGFYPSKRAFQDQLRRWGFDKAKTPAEREELTAQIEHLRKQNQSQHLMAQTLRDRGFSVSTPTVARICLNNGWSKAPKSRGRRPSRPLDVDEEAHTLAHLFQEHEELMGATPTNASNTETPTRSSNEESGSKPQYPSDLSLDKAKRILDIEEDDYRNISNAYMRICRESKISGKSDTSDADWELARNNLLHEARFLAEKLRASKDIEQAFGALDIICKHILKNARLADSNMTQREAKDILGLVRTEGDEAREVLAELLSDANFDSKSAAVPTAVEWNVLERQWGSKCPKIKAAQDKIRNLDGTEDEIQQKKKALNVLSRDVLKRLRDTRPTRSRKRSFDSMTSHSSQRHVYDTGAQNSVNNMRVGGNFEQVEANLGGINGWTSGNANVRRLSQSQSEMNFEPSSGASPGSPFGVLATLFPAYDGLHHLSQAMPQSFTSATASPGTFTFTTHVPRPPGFIQPGLVGAQQRFDTQGQGTFGHVSPPLMLHQFDSNLLMGRESHASQAINHGSPEAFMHVDHLGQFGAGEGVQPTSGVLDGMFY